MQFIFHTALNTMLGGECSGEIANAGRPITRVRVRDGEFSKRQNGNGSIVAPPYRRLVHSSVTDHVRVESSYVRATCSTRDVVSSFSVIYD